MTPARKKALQWFHDRGEVLKVQVEMPMTMHMVRRMIDDLQLHAYILRGVWHYALTDKGRCALNGDDV